MAVVVEEVDGAAAVMEAGGGEVGGLFGGEGADGDKFLEPMFWSLGAVAVSNVKSPREEGCWACGCCFCSLLGWSLSCFCASAVGLVGEREEGEKEFFKFLGERGGGDRGERRGEDLGDLRDLVECLARPLGDNGGAGVNWEDDDLARAEGEELTAVNLFSESSVDVS